MQESGRSEPECTRPRTPVFGLPDNGMPEVIGEHALSQAYIYIYIYTYILMDILFAVNIYIYIYIYIYILDMGL